MPRFVPGAIHQRSPNIAPAHAAPATAAAAPAPAPTAAPAAGGIPTWVWIAGGAVVLLLAWWFAK